MFKKAGMLLLMLLSIFSAFSGCISTGEKNTEWKPAESVSRPPYIHTVKYPGETLLIISKWYTGEESNWEAIADANPSVDYEKLTAGSRLFVPEGLLKTTEPLTEEFINASLKKSKPVIKKEEKKKPVSKPRPRPKKDEDFDLIGPK